MKQLLQQPEITEAVFIARELSKAYRMGDVDVHALRSVNLELYKGELVLLGASGSGKSTLLILGGLDVPTTGEVFYRDHNLSIDDDAELTRYRREHVGFVFQFYNLIPSLTALENVELVTDIAENPMRPRKPCNSSGSVTECITFLLSFPVVSNSEWRLLAP